MENTATANAIKTKLWTYEITKDETIIDTDRNGKVIPILLDDDFTLRIPLYINKSQHHKPPFIEHNGKIWSVETIVQLKSQINIFVLPCGSSDPKKSPICIID
jgi:lipopolysaccharide biosynthesis protein